MKKENILRLFLYLVILLQVDVFSDDLKEIKERGVLKHLGVSYANFVTGSGDGLSVDIMKLFAAYLDVEYEFVPSSWKNIISDLTGKKVRAVNDDVEITGTAEIKGDVIANGLTKLSWREKIVNYSYPVFPTQVWLIARSDSDLQPIVPSGDVDYDIKSVKAMFNGESMFCVQNTCLDSGLYSLGKEKIKIINFSGKLNELAPALIKGEAELCILDVPDALIALEKWPGKIKVIGPISEKQVMGVGFSKDSPELLKEFNKFFKKIRQDGTFINLVKKYYPAVFDYYENFFV